MKKKKRNPKATSKNYLKYSFDNLGPEYYGLIKKDGRVRVDLKRMKKIKTSGIPDKILQYASDIPRNTSYFLPEKIHRKDYIFNRFKDKLTSLSNQWAEYKKLFEGIKKPSDVAESTRLSYLLDGNMDFEESLEKGTLAGIKRIKPYHDLWIAFCANFIHQIAVELDALLLQQCILIGYQQKNVSHCKLYNFLNSIVEGKKIENLPNYQIYRKFFIVNNFLKHNSEELFEKVKVNYPEILLCNKFRNGMMSQYLLKIENGYIESMLSNLALFYKELCETFFNENTIYSEWNYDDYFINTINKTINTEIDQLG